MRNLQTSTPIFLILAVFSLSGCFRTDDKGIEAPPVSSTKEENISSLAKEYDVIVKKKDGAMYFKEALVTASKIKESPFNETPSIEIKNNGGFIVASEGSTGSLNNKIINANGKTYESRDYGVVKNHLFNGTNVAYYKCEKLIYFSETNSNDCLANQIWLDGKLVDSVDMEFLKKNRKYPFYLKWLGEKEFVYQKGEDYYQLKIGEDEPRLFSEIKGLNLAHKDAQFNFIGLVGKKILYSLESEKGMYDDILYDTQIIPQLNGENADKVIPHENFDLYIDQKLFDTHVVSYKILGNDVYAVKYRNVKFEQDNPNYFRNIGKPPFQGITKDVSEFHVEYSLYKNKELVNVFDFKSAIDSAGYSIGRLDIIDGESEPCVYNNENYARDATVCVYRNSYAIQTRTSMDLGFDVWPLLYNGIKLNTNSDSLVKIFTDMGANKDEKEKADYFKTNSGKLLKDIVMVPEKVQPVFTSDGKLHKILLFGRVNDDSFKEMISMIFLGSESDEYYKHVSDKLQIANIPLLKKVDKEGISKLTGAEKIEGEKYEKYIKEMLEGKKGLFEAEYLGNGTFGNPKMMMTGIEDFYGAAKK